MPGKARQLSATIPSPLLPGLYTLTSTIIPDHGTPITTKHTILYLPPWAMIVLGALLIALVYRLVRRSRIRRLGE